MNTLPIWMCVVCLAAHQVTARVFDIQEASSRIQDGTTLADRTTEEAMEEVASGYSVVCGVEVENWTKWPMESMVAHAEDGYISLRPSFVMPGTREVLVAHKGSYTSTGSYGVASWIIRPPSGARRVVVMWSVPLNFMASNWLAVGITSPYDETPKAEWAEQMYYDDSDIEFQFVRSEFSEEGQEPIRFHDGSIDIVATMETGYWPKVQLEIRPTHADDLASGLE